MSLVMPERIKVIQSVLDPWRATYEGVTVEFTTTPEFVASVLPPGLVQSGACMRPYLNWLPSAPDTDVDIDGALARTDDAFASLTRDNGRP